MALPRVRKKPSQMIGTQENQAAGQEKRPLNLKRITWGDLTWIDIMPPTEREIAYLAETFKFHPLDLDDCLSHKQRPKIDEYKDYLFIVFQFPVFSQATRTSSPRQVSVFMLDGYLITLHTGELTSLVQLFNECETKEEWRKEHFSYGSGYLWYRILDRAADSYFPVLDKILSLIEGIEDTVFDENVEAGKEVAILRRDIITQRRVIFPMRSLMAEIEAKIKRFTRIDLTVYYGDLMDHMHKITETLDECKEVIEVFKDTDHVLATYRINRVMRVLTVLGSITLPFLAVASIYGMNVPLPGGLERGSLYTFVILVGSMLLISGTMLYLFRRKGWL